MDILSNSETMTKTRDDTKRIHRPMLESDQVIAFLNKTLEKTDEIITQWNIDNKVDIEDD